jgi:alkylation response protein AidB-like acyl-CoA dehydrogenase
MDFRLTKEQEKRRREFFDVCKQLEKDKPANIYTFLDAFEIDTEEEIAYEKRCRREFARRGWLRLGWPAEYGGVGTMIDRAFLAEATGYHGIPGVDPVGIGLLAPMLIAEAGEDIKKRFLPPIGNGDVLWCELWSEPNAGSDLAALSTTAIRKGDEYIVNGQKTWTSFGHRADWGFGLFKTDLQAPKNHNISLLLLDMRSPGITISHLYYMDGKHFYNDVFLDDVHVPAENIVGEENNGWMVAQTLLGFERSNLGAVMIMQRQLEDLVKYCNETQVGGKILAHDPIIRNRLAGIACEIGATRGLAYHIADLQDRHELAMFEASAIKVFTAELGEHMAALGADILGAYGQVRDSKWAPMGGAWERTAQTCFIGSIAAGTNEIQKNIIAWYGLGMPRPPKPTPKV